jgi:hypothetical protein
MLLDIYHILTFFLRLENMFKLFLLFLFIQQVLSTDKEVISISDHPLFTKILGLIDQLVVQVRRMQTLIIRTYDMIEQMPNDLRPFFSECFTAEHNASKARYSSNLNEAEISRIPRIKTQLKEATTLEQQLNIMNMTDRIVEDITYNVVKPSLSFVTGIIDCIRSKLQTSIG